MASPSVLRKSGNMVIRPLSALAQGLTAIQNRLYQQPNVNIAGIGESNWPSALQPVRPFGQPGTQPLGMNIQMGQNLIFTPRPDARYSAADLQTLATYPLARMCIESVKSIISTLPWKIQLKAQPGEARKERESRQLKDDTIKLITDFVSHPDSEHDFKDWLPPLLEDMLTIDAGSILLRFDPKGVVYEWRVMQGGYIVRYVTDQGYTPEPPSPAYSQLWEGIPLVDLTSDQLIYRPRNIVYRVGNVSYSLYGFSPTEQLAPEIEVGIQRLRYVTAFYRDGSVPNVMWVVPPGVKPDKIEEARKVYNSNLAGNLESRRMVTFSQGFVDDGKDAIHQFKEPELADSYDDLHTRRICFGYGTSAQRLIRMMTRSTATSNQEAAEEEGIAPFREWVEGVINGILQRKMGYDKYEFAFETQRDPDPLRQSQIDAADVDAGIKTINEARVARGMDERPEPEANELGKFLTTGWASISTPPPPVKAPAPAGPRTQPAISGNVQPQKLLKSGVATETPTIDPSRESIRTRNDKAKIYSKLLQFFNHIKSTMVIVSKPVRKMRKAEDDKQKQIDQIVESIMAGIQWDALPAYVQDALTDAGEDGVHVGLNQIERMEVAPDGVAIVMSPQPVRVVTQSMISEVNQVAADYARERAAELVGMKYVDNELVENPNAQWAITDSTRNMLRDIITEAFEHEAPFSDLVSRIKDAGVFSDERAKMIADTEVKFAQVGGNYAAWEKSGLVKKVRSLLSANHIGPDECDDNSEAGEIEFGTPFPSGQLHSPFHIRCQCSIQVTSIGGLSQKW
jgi:portal protein